MNGIVKKASVEYTYQGEWFSTTVPRDLAEAYAEALKAKGALGIKIYHQL
jgi:hypothetical protein